MLDSSAPMSGVKALFFDVFGTTVDWRSTVTKALHAQAKQTLNLAECNTPLKVREKASRMGLQEWGEFAQRWRESYYSFTRKVAHDDQVPYKSVDEHHFDALNELLEEWHLAGFWSPDTIKELSLIWHKLDPWPDTVSGIKTLNKKFQTCTLSNGNVTLLADMARHAHLEWTHIFSAEMFKTYKPNPQVYNGGAEKLGLRAEECAMVAAHLNDLQAASSLGFRTIYVERPLEEQWDPATVSEVKKQGWVDIWVNGDEDGFLAAAERLGIDQNHQSALGSENTLINPC